MSEIARVGQPVTGDPQILRLGPDRASVSGTVAQVNNVITRLQAEGKLASVSNPVPNGLPGGILVTVRVCQPQPIPASQSRRWSRNRIIAVAVAITTVLTLCGLGVRAIYLWVVGHAAGIESAGIIILIIGGVVAVKALGGGRSFSGTFQGRIR